MPDMLGSHCAAVGFVAAYALEYGLRKRQEGKCQLNKERLDENSRQYGSDGGSSDRSSDRRLRLRDGLAQSENMYSNLVNGKTLAGVAVAGLLAYQVNNMRRKDSKKDSQRKRYGSVDYEQDAARGRRYSYSPESEVIETENRMREPPVFKLRNGSEGNISQSSRSRARSQSRFRTPVYAPYV